MCASTRPIRALLLLLGLVSLVGMPYAVLMPIFADRILHRGANGLGMLMGATGVGALIGALTLAFKRGLNGLGNWITFSSAGFGAALILFGISRTFWLSVALLVPAGYSMMVQMASSNTLIQSMVPDRLRGRVMSVYSMMFMGMAPIGALGAGVVAAPSGRAVGRLHRRHGLHSRLRRLWRALPQHARGSAASHPRPGHGRRRPAAGDRLPGSLGKGVDVGDQRTRNSAALLRPALYWAGMASEKTFYLETFGCQMNVHDSEKVVGTLISQGYRQVESVEEAGLVLYNTCSIRDKAEQKVFHRLADFRKLARQGKKFGVLGCVAQQEGEKIFERAPHVSLVCGSASYRNLPQMLVQLGGREARHRARRPPDHRDFRDRIHRPQQSASRLHHHHRGLRQVLRFLRGSLYARARAQPYVG